MGMDNSDRLNNHIQSVDHCPADVIIESTNLYEHLGVHKSRVSMSSNLNWQYNSLSIFFLHLFLVHTCSRWTLVLREGSLVGGCSFTLRSL